MDKGKKILWKITNKRQNLLIMNGRVGSAVLALKSPAKDICLYDLEKVLISKSMSLNAF
jgi:hypothetical protein